MKISEVFDLDAKRMEGKHIYFCSDLHYNHKNAISFGNRPFNDVSEMNNSILNEIQSTITPGDILFTLGDDFWEVKENDIINILDSIPTTKLYKIMGNHDKYGYYMGGGKVGKKYKVLADLLDISIKKDGAIYNLALCHYPIWDYNRMFHGALHLFGHVHGNLDEELRDNPKLMVDVGYDGQLAKRAGSFLIKFEDILDYFFEKTGGLDFDTWGRRNYKSTVKGYGETERISGE